MGNQLWASSKIAFFCCPHPWKYQLVSEEFTWMSQPLCMFQLYLFLISGLSTCVFSSSGFYEGMSQHLNIFKCPPIWVSETLYVLKRRFRMRMLKVCFWNWHLIFLVLLTCPTASPFETWHLNDGNAYRNTTEKEAQPIAASILTRKCCSFESRHKPSQEEGVAIGSESGGGGRRRNKL